MYKAREQTEILQELQNASTTSASKIEGTFENDVFATNSIEFAKQEVELEQVYKAGFAQTTWGEYLDLRAAEHGIFRKQAVKAIGTVTVKGTGEVPAGSIFTTSNGINFVTLKTTQVNQFADIDIEASIAGINGNVKAGMINIIPMQIPGITSVENSADTHDGFDEETDAELYARLDFKVKKPATSGNVNNYIEWTSSVEGVGKIVIKPLWNGNGTVKVIIADANNQTASDDLIRKVADYIETQRPIGATVTVTTFIILTVNISLKVTKGKGNLEGIKTIINRYFKSDDFDATVVSCAHIGKEILTNSNETQVLDYEDLTINGSSDNIPLDDEHMATVGEVKFKNE